MQGVAWLTLVVVTLGSQLIPLASGGPADRGPCPRASFAHPGPCEIFVAEKGESEADVELLVGLTGFLPGRDGALVFHVGTTKGSMDYEVPPTPRHSHRSFVMCDPNSKAVEGEDPVRICNLGGVSQGGGAALGSSPMERYECGGVHNSMMASLHARVPVGFTDVHVHLVDNAGRFVSESVHTAIGVEPAGFDHAQDTTKETLKHLRAKDARIAAEKKEHRERDAEIAAAYDPHRLHAPLLSPHLNPIVHPLLARVIEERTPESVWGLVREEVAPGVYAFPFLTEEAIATGTDASGRPHLAAQIVSELESFLGTEPGRRAPPPNTMNKHGRTLAAMGLVDLESSLLHLVLQPIAQALFPEWIGETLDHSHGFVVKYDAEERGNRTRKENPGVDDAGLALHMDASEVTLNMALGGEHSGGFLIFRGVRGTGSERVVSHRVRVRPGWAIVHVGQHWHEAETLDGGVGKRYNLILWGKSQSRRDSAEERFIRRCGTRTGNMHHHFPHQSHLAGGLHSSGETVVKDEV